MGYSRAGWAVLGVDKVVQPRYPFDFVQGDAIQFVLDHGHKFDAIHASTPCHDFTDLVSRSGPDGTAWMLPAMRQALISTGRPWVMENVPAAPMRADITLCGSMFNLGAGGRMLKRHRIFESNIPLTAPVDRCAEHALAGGLFGGVYGDGGGGQQTRGYKFYAAESREAMGIDWMRRPELSQALPPAYTEHIGRQLLAYAFGAESHHVSAPN
jgi:DNA (cytosine-5)-methyltransferase 1